MFKRIGMVWLAGAGIGLAVFIVGILLGLFLPADALKQDVVIAVLGKFSGILEGAGNSWELVIRIFLNNLLVAFILLGSGVFIILPVIILFGNGFVIGVFIDLLNRSEPLAPGTLASGLASLIPHSLFELSAIFLAGTLGIVLMVKLILPKLLLPHYTRSEVATGTVAGFVLLVIPLLFVAAVVETFISPALAAKVQAQFTPKQDTAAVVALLDTDALATEHCIPSQTVESGQLSPEALQVFYEPETYEMIKRIAQTQPITLVYACENNTQLTITAYQAELVSKPELRTFLTKTGQADADISELGQFWVTMVHLTRQ